MLGDTFMLLFKIPVFRGCGKPIIHSTEDAQFYHGKDGLGDLRNEIEVDISCIQEEHAVTALLRLSKKYPGTTLSSGV